VCVSVRDTGIGLSPDDQTQLFTKFFRAENSATQGVSGTGLGLAITQALVELHGGSLTVTSAGGRARRSASHRRQCRRSGITTLILADW
jgi:signal transduction histidine kinase